MFVYHSQRRKVGKTLEQVLNHPFIARFITMTSPFCLAQLVWD